MAARKATEPRRYWADVSDDQLIDLDLEIDNPESLAALVREFPLGNEEPYVEFKYDLRGLDVAEFSCVHGHHQHKAGFVFRKGNDRFLVGHICGKTIYGEDFDQYTADFNAAVVRRDALQRVREVREAIIPFAAWIDQISQSDILKHFSKLRGQLDNHMPWIYDNLTAFAHMDHRITGVVLPKFLCSGSGASLRADFDRLSGEVRAASTSINGDPKMVAGVIGSIRSRMEGLAKRAETILDQLQDVEVFFQPAVLAVICDLANKHDNPKRRKYEPGMLAISCKRDNGKTIIPIPKGFAMPSRKPLEAFRAAVAGVAIGQAKKAARA